MAEDVTVDRRPIATRNLRVSQAAAEMLARRGVSANAISVVGMLCAVVAGACLIGTRLAEPFGQRVLFVGAAACVQLRLLANMLDGMVAIASGRASAVGELFNEVPDRVSDTVILVAAGYAMGGEPALGWGAAAVALFVSYIRAVGKGLGVAGLFQGPMSKSHRMFTLTVTCVYLGVAPERWQPVWHVGRFRGGILMAALALIVAGGMVTAARRLIRIVRAVKERAA